MLAAAKPPTVSPHLRHASRKPLQPKPSLFNFINHLQHDPPNSNSINKPLPSHQQQQQQQQTSLSSSSINDSISNKENLITNSNTNVQLIDASLAQELTAVKLKMDRLKSDKDKTQSLLRQRDRVLEVQMTELLHRGEFQKDLEIEVDRLYRLKHLKLACVKTSPIRSLREKEMEKKNNESQHELLANEEKSEESKEELLDASSTTGSPTPTMSLESSSASTAASITTATTSTATSKTISISSRFNLESDFDDK